MPHSTPIASPENSVLILFGFGGEGGRSLVSFAEKCALNPSYGLEVLSRVHFILIDTDVKDLDKSKTGILAAAAKVPGLKLPEINMLSIGRGIDSFSDAVVYDAERGGWADLEPNSPIFDAVWTKEENGKRTPFKALRAQIPPSKGASQSPMISSYLMLRSIKELDEILNGIRRKVAERHEGARPRIVVVTSLAGGTGRGSWWIATLRARKIFGRDQFPSGIFLDWSCFEDRRRQITDDGMNRLMVNSMTGFAELAAWLRLRLDETAGQPTDYLIPSLERPSDRDPFGAVVDSRLLASPNDPTNEGAAERLGRSPVSRAFVVTGQSDGVASAGADAAASLLLGWTGLAHTDSTYSNIVDLCGTGMASIASIPLASLKRGANLQVRASALDTSLLASHEFSVVEQAVLNKLDGILKVPSKDSLLEWGKFQQAFISSGVESQGEKIVKAGDSLLERALSKILDQAPTSTLREGMDEQQKPEDITILEDLWTSDSGMVKKCYEEASSEWLSDQLRFVEGGEVVSVDSATSRDFAGWIFKTVMTECKHGDGDQMFSIAAHHEGLKECVQLLGGAADSVKKMLQSLEREEREARGAGQKAASGAGQTAGNTAYSRIFEELKSASGRSGLLPIWPAPRYSNDEITDVEMVAKYEFLRANMKELLALHLARLGALTTAIEVASVRAKKALDGVRQIAVELHKSAEADLGYDARGRASVGTRAVDAACRIVPAAKEDRWIWLEKELNHFAGMRKSRRFVLPVLLNRADELASLDAIKSASASLGPVLSKLAADFLSGLGFAPVNVRGDGGYVQTAEEVEHEEQGKFMSSVKRRLEALALSGNPEREFDAACGLARQVRLWAQQIGEIDALDTSPEVRIRVNELCKQTLGFNMAEARALSDISVYRSKLMYRFARRLAEDNDVQTLLPREIDGARRQDVVTILVKDSMRDGLDSAMQEAAADAATREQMGFPNAKVSFAPINSDHLMFLTTWEMIPDRVLAHQGWSVWQSFTQYTDPKVLQMLSGVDDVGGSSVFNAPAGAVGLGYSAPIFLRNDAFAAKLWRPWVKSTAAPKARRTSFALLYAMLGNTEGIDANAAGNKALISLMKQLGEMRLSAENPDARWTMPLFAFQGDQNRVSWSLRRSPFEPLGTGEAAGFRVPSPTTSTALTAKFSSIGPVQIIRELNTPEGAELIDRILKEHAVLMALARRSPLMDIWTDTAKRSVGRYLRDLIAFRRSKIGAANAEFARMQNRFYDDLEETLSQLERGGRSILDPFVS